MLRHIKISIADDYSAKLNALNVIFSGHSPKHSSIQMKTDHVTEWLNGRRTNVSVIVKLQTPEEYNCLLYELVTEQATDSEGGNEDDAQSDILSRSSRRSKKESRTRARNV